MAKKMIEDSLPIKCLEAVILSIYLTNEIGFHANTYLTNNLEKFTIGFKTTSMSNVHRHVVLGVYCHVTGMFGSLGTSRRSDLGYKSLSFKTLTDLLLDFIETYSVYLHKVKRVKLGMPLPYSNRSFESIQWNGCTINVSKASVAEWSKICEKHARVIRLNTLNTTGNTQGQQISTPSLRNINAQKGSKSKLNKSQEANLTKEVKKLTETSSMFENTESTNSIENKIISDISNNQEKSASDLVSASPLLNLRRNETVLSLAKTNYPLAMPMIRNDLENHSSHNVSRQSAHTSNSMISLVNGKNKAEKNKSLRV